MQEIRVYKIKGGKKQMNGVITMGEALIDFIPVDSQNKLYKKNPGGAPANVVVGLSRLGSETAFITKVGDDVLGRYLYEVFDKEEINLNNMLLTNQAKTQLSIVTLNKSGDRKFDFFVEKSADKLLKKEEIDQENFEEYKIFHFGSISMIDEGAREATLYALDLAVENGMYVSYDPNLRERLWDNLDKARKVIKTVLGKVDILKISREELIFLTQVEELENGVEQIKNKNGIKLVLITDGDNGAYFYKDELHHVPTKEIDAVDTTGAGDAFVSAFLNRIDKCSQNLEELNKIKIEKFCQFANYCSSLVITKEGAMTKLPYIKDVKEFLKA